LPIFLNKTTLDSRLSGTEAVLTFTSPLTRTASNKYRLKFVFNICYCSTTYAAVTNLNAKEETLTLSAPLTRTSNMISID
jgi:hypothetical protein